MPGWIGFDFGATNLRAATVDLENGITGPVFKTATPAQGGPGVVIDAIISLIQEVIASEKTHQISIAGVGIGCPAAVDLAKGILLNVPNIPGDWPSISFQAILGTRLGLPVFPINDVRAITLGEFQYGAGRGVDNLACYAVGTGIGGGVVINGRLHLGISGSAGELGHQVVEADGLPCNCGGRGCLETIASGPAIAGQAAQAVIYRRSTILGQLCGGDLNRISPATVIEAARQKDKIAQEILDRAGRYLGIAITNTLVTICPRKILIGGGVGIAAGELLLTSVRQTVRERSHMVPLDQIEIGSTQLGDSAGLFGAALWAKAQSDQLGAT